MTVRHIRLDRRQFYLFEGLGINSHNGIMNRKDFDQMVDLLVAMLLKLDAATVEKVRDFTP